MFTNLIIIVLVLQGSMVCMKCTKQSLKWNHERISVKTIDNIDVNLVETNDQNEIDSVVMRLNTYSNLKRPVDKHKLTSRIKNDSRSDHAYSKSTATVNPASTPTSKTEYLSSYLSSSSLNLNESHMKTSSPTSSKSNSSTFKKALKETDMIEDVQSPMDTSSQYNKSSDGVGNGKGFFETLKDIFQID